jgi:hypothetical protein
LKIKKSVEILTDSADVKQYIKRMLSRDEQLKSNWGTICTPVEMIAADDKTQRQHRQRSPFEIRSRNGPKIYTEAIRKNASSANTAPLPICKNPPPTPSSSKPG